ncbi:MAG TPA: KTSC domain-containing protein [Pyrinomonadaceae bacterium]|nr:KTSC domain-containing protein [Pyrinomonadaceae bacterium]
MIDRRRFIGKAGSLASLPFLLFGIFLLRCEVSLAEEEKVTLTFQEFKSSCIDLGHYDSKRRQLTVRFVNRNAERFYCYQNVPRDVWRRLEALNESGGVGNYLNETVVQHPHKYPFQELSLRKFRTVATKTKKAEDSK